MAEDPLLVEWGSMVKLYLRVPGVAVPAMLGVVAWCAVASSVPAGLVFGQESRDSLEVETKLALRRELERSKPPHTRRLLPAWPAPTRGHQRG